MLRETVETFVLLFVCIGYLVTSSFVQMPEHVIDLIDGLRQKTEEDGKSLIANLEGYSLSFVFEDADRTLKMPQHMVGDASKYFQKHKVFSMIASVKQKKHNVGSLIAFTFQNKSKLELESSGRRNEIRLHYSVNGSSLTETMPYRLADGLWHKVAVIVSATQLTLYIDCSQVYKRTILPIDKCTNDWELWLGQRNRHFSVFKGSLRDVKIAFGNHGYLLQCPVQDNICPTCEQFGEMEQTVAKLSKHIEKLEGKLSQVEGRLADLEECECTKTCLVDGSKIRSGEMWRKDMCTICSCVDGHVNCSKTTCPQPACKYPVLKPGECCPTCLRFCSFRGHLTDHGEKFSPRACVTCTCQDGENMCQRENPAVICPPLNCSIDQQFKHDGQCCSICLGQDFCSKRNNCHKNATCINLHTKHECHCNDGFYGDGINCKDIDECDKAQGPYRHECQYNSVCVNTVGSYRCDCRYGFYKNEVGYCQDVDECADDTIGLTHVCDEKARCTNTVGSYQCQCLPGYHGDGFTCEVHCDGGCANGGTCMLPNVCRCAHGFLGRSCQEDFDECAFGISSCSNRSRCVNTPSAYLCECLPGFYSTTPNNRLGHNCQDVDECALGTHTCHPTQQCVNTPGSYKCICQGEPADCSTNCVHDSKEYINGNRWLDPANECSSCLCQDGFTNCSKVSCDCTDEVDILSSCCSECDSRQQCSHQDLSHVMFNSGARWNYNCQTCECMDGQVDCWTQECPEMPNCDDPIQNPGECCPHCEHDVIMFGPNPCNWDFNNLADVLAPCEYEGTIHQSGNTWRLETNICVECTCKAGHICCLFDNTCPVDESLIG